MLEKVGCWPTYWKTYLLFIYIYVDFSRGLGYCYRIQSNGETLPSKNDNLEVNDHLVMYLS